MAHEIENQDRFGETHNNGQRAWHGIGDLIPDGLSAREGFKQIGLDWKTKLVPIIVNDAELGEIKDENNFVHTRCDTKASLGVVSKSYKPIDNMQMADFLDELCGADAAVRLETAGSLRNGKRVFASVKLARSIEVVKDDVLDLYMIASNAHDASATFNMYGSSIRPVCANTLRYSERDLSRGISFNHTGDIKEKLDAARQALGLIVKDSERFEKEVKALAAKRWTKDQIKGYFEAIYTLQFGSIPDSLPKKEQERRAEHRTETLARWNNLMQSPKQNIHGIEETAWATYNAYSEWSDHERGRGKSNSDARVHSNLFGESANDKQRAWKLAGEVVKMAVTV